MSSSGQQAADSIGASVVNLGTAVLDLGIQSIMQAAVLTDPFALPTQEGYVLTMQAWAVDPLSGERKVPLMTHTFTVMPQQISLLKNYLARVTMTPGGPQVDDFHMPDTRVVAPYPITITGNFGKRARFFVKNERLTRFKEPVSMASDALEGLGGPAIGMISGYGQTKYMERLADISHQPVNRLIEDAKGITKETLNLEFNKYFSNNSNIAVPVEVVLYNWTFHQFVVVVINSVRFSRSAQLNCWTYTMQLTAIEDALNTKRNKDAKKQVWTDLTRNLLRLTTQAVFDTASYRLNMPGKRSFYTMPAGRPLAQQESNVRFVPIRPQTGGVSTPPRPDPRYVSRTTITQPPPAPPPANGEDYGLD